MTLPASQRSTTQSQGWGGWVDTRESLTPNLALIPEGPTSPPGTPTHTGAGGPAFRLTSMTYLKPCFPEREGRRFLSTRHFHTPSRLILMRGMTLTCKTPPRGRETHPFLKTLAPPVRNWSQYPDFLGTRHSITICKKLS